MCLRTFIRPFGSLVGREKRLVLPNSRHKSIATSGEVTSNKLVISLRKFRYKATAITQRNQELKRKLMRKI